MTPGDEIAPDEHLGRRVFSRRDRRRAQRGRLPLKVFLDKEPTTEISTDRVDATDAGSLTAIADPSAASRPGPFRGWAVVTYEAACKSSRSVQASPLPDNPYHADIILPNDAADDREEQHGHAQELADSSTWLERHGGQPDGLS